MRPEDRSFQTRYTLHDGQAAINDLVADIEDIETGYESIKALRKVTAEFQIYIAKAAWMIPNYTERRRYGERVSTGFVESTVNTVVRKRFDNRQQMRWSKAGAHHMLLIRTRTLDRTLRSKFEQWVSRDEVGISRPPCCRIDPRFEILSYVAKRARNPSKHHHRLQPA